MLKLISLILLLSQLCVAQMILVNPRRALVVNPSTVAGVSHYSDSLKYYYIDNGYSNGAINYIPDIASGWVENAHLYTFTAFEIDTTRRADMTANGLLFDGDDGYRTYTDGDSTHPISFTGLPISLEMIFKVTDSSAAILGGIRHDRALTLSFAGGNFCVFGFDGTDAPLINRWGSTVYNTMVHVVAIYSGGTDLHLYVNGVEATTIADPYLGSSLSSEIISLGGSETSNYVKAGTIIREMAIYNKDITAQVADNYEYFQSIGYVP